MPKVIALLLAGLTTAWGQGADNLSAFPVKRVVLYKNGVGYFEHTGRVQGNQEVNIPFTSGQLNDVLKSLTVLDLNGGTITGVAWGSTAPVDRQLGELRLPSGEKASLSDFLAGLRGAKLEVRNGPVLITGRLLSVERKTRMSAGATLEVDYLALVTDSGEIRTTELSLAFSVKLLETGLPGKVNRLLDIASGNREPDVRRMVVSAAGTGQRSLFVSYISEVPVWKATYRIVLGSKPGESPLLQGWAIVDNTVGQDWENVELSLVAGAPQSFVQNLSQPFYARRPVVPLSAALNSSPQTYESTLIAGGGRVTGTVRDPNGTVITGASVRAMDESGNTVGSARTGPDGSYTITGLPEGTVRIEADLPGFSTSETSVMASVAAPARADFTIQVGSLAQTVTVNASASTLNTSQADRSAESGRNLGGGSALGGNASRPYLKVQAPPPPPGRGAGGGGGFGAGVYGAAQSTNAGAAGQELGDLFEYKLTKPVTIRKNQSAMVPIANAKIGAEKVSIYNEAARLPRPTRALWLTNTSGLTLDGGSFSVLEQDTFAGEGIFDPIRPGEKRLLSYASDLAVTAGTTIGTETRPVSRVVIDKGLMVHYSELREKKTYTFRNEDSSARTVLVEHPVRLGRTLVDDVEPAETTPSYYRFRVSVPAKESASLVVQEVQPLSSSVALTNIDGNLLALMIRDRKINPAIEEQLRKVLAQKDVVSRILEENEKLDQRLSGIFDDQQRLRENLKSLKGSVEEKALVQRYTRQLDDQENQLASLRKAKEDGEKKESEERDKLDAMIRSLSFDEKL